MALPEKLPIHSDARLADLGALQVFRHWLESLLQDMTRPTVDPEDSPQPERLARLFF